MNYHKDCTIGCSAALKSGKNKEEVSDPELKTSVKEIEKARAETTELIKSVMRGDSNKQGEAQVAQEDFNKQTNNLDVRLICSVGRVHGSSNYTLTVANAE